MRTSLESLQFTTVSSTVHTGPALKHLTQGHTYAVISRMEVGGTKDNVYAYTSPTT